MQPLNVSYHFSNEKCKSNYIDTVISSLDELVYPDEYLGYMPDMITITQNISYFDAEGIEQSIVKKVMLIVGRKENATKVLDNREGYLVVVQSRLESAIPLLKVKGNSFLPDQADISPYNFAHKCPGNPRQMVVYKEPTTKKKYIFPKTKLTKDFETSADLKEGFYTFAKAYFANDNTKGEKPKVYTKNQNGSEH